MNLRYWLIAIGVTFVALVVWRQSESLLADSNVGKAHDQPQARVESPYLGAGSCSASACHNNQHSLGIVGSEYTLWATRDPHARAYESLFNSTSLAIQKSLNVKTAPHEDPRCLKCHVSPMYDSPRPVHFKTDGVSCETCHGPAKGWIDLHHLDAWQQKSAAEKQHFGMRDLYSIVGRARACVPCHVGAPGMDVDHDLIAAGHPRLRFEFAAFHAHLPRHWPDETDRKGRADFTARLWVAGQLESARAALELLAHRADPKRTVWPEFAEHDCAACHQDLSDREPRDYAKRKPATPPWSGQLTLIEPTVRSIDPAGDAMLADALAKLRATFDSAKPDRRIVAINAKIAAARLTPWLDAFEQRSLHPKWFEKLSDEVRDDRIPLRGVDATTNQLLAWITLRQARMDIHLPNAANQRYDDLLKNADRLQRTIPFEPAAIRARLRSIPR